jgi:hypothetical protein
MTKALVASTVTGNPVTVDISPGKTFRGICQGTSGAGKSVLLTTLVCELAKCSYRQIICFDDKYVSFLELLPRVYIFDEQIRYNDALSSIAGELKRRLVALKGLGKKELIPQDGYCQLDLIVDEASSFLTPDDPAVTKGHREERLRLLCTIAQLGRCCGISLLLATQVASSKNIDTSLRNLLVDVKFGLRSGSQESTRFLTGDRYDEAPMELLPAVPGLMYCMSNDDSTGNHFVKCKVIHTPLEVVEQIAQRTSHFRKELTFLDSASDDYAY